MISDEVKTRVAIAAETITGGGLAHYTEDIDEALRSHAGEHQRVEGTPFHPPLFGPRKGARPGLRGVLKRNPLLVRLVRYFRKRRQRSPWADAAAWAGRWRAMPPEVIAILPHVVIHDDGELDDYYAALAERPFVLVIHDLHPLHYPDQWRPRDVERTKERFTSLSARASQIIVHNEFTAQDVVEKLGVERQRISVVLLPAFFSEAAFSGSPETDLAALAKLGIRKPYALWASSSTFVHKNHLTLLRAWRLLLDRGCAVQLVCTGSKEPRWKDVEAAIAAEKLGSSVRFTGIVSDVELAAIMRNTHLAICPTLFEGGGPGPAAEAMMAGIPLTLSDIPQCRELFNLRTDLCTFFDPYDPAAIADAVEDLMKHYPEAQGRAAFARGEYAAMRTQQSAAAEYWQAVENARRRVHSAT